MRSWLRFLYRLASGLAMAMFWLIQPARSRTRSTRANGLPALRRPPRLWSGHDTAKTGVRRFSFGRTLSRSGFLQGLELFRLAAAARSALDHLLLWRRAVLAPFPDVA